MSPFPYALTYPQDAHERLLIERLDALGVKVERRTELVRFEQRPESVRAVLKRPDGSEEVCEAAYLAGCDGARSTVREALATGFPGGTYSGLFYVADVDAAGPAANGEIHVDFEEADFLAVFPLKGTGRLRLVGPVAESRTANRELTFDDVSDRAIKNLKLTVAKVNWFSTYHVHHRVAAKFREGRAFLLGDAAHVHSPVGGQGMNTGIGDAVNLAWKLAAVLNGGAARRPARHLRAGADRLRAPAGRHHRSRIHRGDEAGRGRPVGAHPALPADRRVAVPAGPGAPFPVPHRVADRRQLSPQPAERGCGRGRPGRRSPALGRDRAGKR